MKKRISAIAVVVVLALGLAAFIVACGGGGSGSGSSTPSITPISTPTQGAKSASGAVSAVRSISNTGLLLSGLTSVGGAAPIIKTAFTSGSASTVAEKFAARFAPAVKRAKAMRASMAGYPTTTSCTDGSTVAPGTTNSMTMDVDASGTTIIMTLNHCRESVTMTDGVMIMSADSQNATSGRFTVGSDERPFVETIYSNSTSTVVNEVSTSVATIAFTSTDTSTTNPTIMMTINGYFEDVDHVAQTHEKLIMTNLSIKGSLGSATTIGGVSYTVDTLTLNGSVVGTIYVSDTDQTISYQEGPNTFINVVVVDKYPSAGTGDEYLSIDGMLSISTTPADKCIDGTFSIVTDTPLQIDGVTGQTIAGGMKINGNVVATFNTAGSVSVAVDGGVAVAYTRKELDSLCAL